MKKIVFLSLVKDWYYLMDKFYAGGGENQLFSIMRFLNKKFNLELVSFATNKKKIFYKGINVNTLNYKYSKTNILSSVLREFMLIYTLVKRYKKGIYIQKIFTPESFFILIASRLSGSKFILINSSDRLLTDVYYNKFNFIKRWMLGFTLKHVDLIISQNRLQKRQYEEQYKKESIIIHNMIDDIPDIDMDKYNKEYFLWVGRDIEVKRFNLYVELARSSPRIRFIAITNAEIRNKPDNLEILPLMKREELYSYYREAIALINTSKWEGFPNVYLESWANGSGVITLRIDPDDIIRKNNIGYVCDDDIDMMKKKVEYLWENKEEAYNIGERAREYVKRNHSMENIGKKWQEVLNKL